MVILLAVNPKPFQSERLRNDTAVMGNMSLLHPLFEHSYPNIKPQPGAGVLETLKLLVCLLDDTLICFGNPAWCPTDALDPVDIGSDASGPDDAHQQDRTHRVSPATLATQTMPPSTCWLSFHSSARNSPDSQIRLWSSERQIHLQFVVLGLIGFRCSTGKIRRSLVRLSIPPASRPIYAEHGACPDF